MWGYHSVARDSGQGARPAVGAGEDFERGGLGNIVNPRGAERGDGALILGVRGEH